MTNIFKKLGNRLTGKPDVSYTRFPKPPSGPTRAKSVMPQNIDWLLPSKKKKGTTIGEGVGM